jgi:predicted nucleotidyltransferase
MERFVIGAVCYIPEIHKLIQVRAYQNGLVVCGEMCNYFRDSKTTIGLDEYEISATKTWVPINDPSAHEFLEMDEFGWRVIEETLINKTAMQETVLQVVNNLKKVDDIEDIYLFGSVARNGSGHDIDIIVTVSDTLFQKWTTSVKRKIVMITDGDPEIEDMYFNAAIRFDAAAELLGLDFIDFCFEFFDANGLRGYPVDYICVDIDLFLFPHDWKERLEELQTHLPHSDPKFMEKIAKDATLL